MKLNSFHVSLVKPKINNKIFSHLEVKQPKVFLFIVYKSRYLSKHTEFNGFIKQFIHKSFLSRPSVSEIFLLVDLR